MKKTMMTLVALCVAGVASAVTAGWTDWQTVGGDKTAAGWSDTIQTSGSTSMAISVGIVFGGSAGSLASGSAGTILTFGRDVGASRPNQGCVSLYNDGGTLKLALGGVVFGGTASAPVTGGTLTTTMPGVTLDKTTNYTLDIVILNNRDVAVTLSNGGSVLATITGEANNDLLDSSAFRFQWGNFPGEKDTLPTGYTFSDLQYSVTPLPEPTALALLALGVAGLALRRKVA